MAENIALTCFDREFAKSVGKHLSEMLEMYYVDTIDLYEFDHLPHTLSDMLKAQGLTEFRNKECGTIGYVTDFANTVITFESGAIKRKKNIKKLQERCEVVYLLKPLDDVRTLLDSIKYPTSTVKKFFNVQTGTLLVRDKLLQENAHFVIEIDKKSPVMVANEILAKITQKYAKS